MSSASAAPVCQFNLKLLHLYQCYQLQLSTASAAPVLSIRREPSSVLSTSAGPVLSAPSESMRSPDVSVSNHDI